MLTKENATTQLAEARNESAKARAAYNAATTKKAKAAAASDMEFWSNKAAFLWNAAGRP